MLFYYYIMYKLIIIYNGIFKYKFIFSKLNLLFDDILIILLYIYIYIYIYIYYIIYNKQLLIILVVLRLLYFITKLECVIIGIWELQ